MATVQPRCEGENDDNKRIPKDGDKEEEPRYSQQSDQFNRLGFLPHMLTSARVALGQIFARPANNVQNNQARKSEGGVEFRVRQELE